MEKPEVRHLTADEIAGLFGPGGGQGMPTAREEHAQSCELCRRMIAMHQVQESRLRRLAGSPRPAPGPLCPPPAEWASLAAGQVDPEKAKKLLAHASECDACGALLHAAAEDFSEETAEASLEALESAKPEWQSRMAGRMAEISRGDRRTVVLEWLAKAAAVLVAVGAGWWGYDHWVARHPARLIAQAYTEQRPFDFRIPSAAHGPVRLERRAGGSSFQRPAPLLDAEARIARELAKNPDSGEWLRLRARAEMLAWNADAAIASLTRTLGRQPDDPGLLADLGMAHALRAETDNRPVDYAPAIEFLTRAIRAKPASAEMVFNRALVYERMFLYEEAERDWRQYLSLDAGGGWADEARRRLAELEKKKRAGGRP